MFKKTRIRLTIWYVLAIMLTSLLFSISFFLLSSREVNRVVRLREMRDEHLRIDPFDTRVPPLSPDITGDIEETNTRLLVILVMLNGGIFILAVVSGYALSGFTLSPIKEMMDEQSRFIADASHELRTPITALKSEIEVNLRNKKLNSKSAKDVLESNLEEVNHLQILSDSLLALSQNKMSNNPSEKSVSISKVVSESISKVRKISKEKGITIKNNVSDTTVYGSSENLTKLFVILLDNAIKYSGKNGKINIVSEVPNGAFIKVHVSDNGVGISSKDLPHIFDRFYRADKSRTEDGYGLGLSIAKQIAQSHNGTIEVESKLKKGTTFTITLPLEG